MKRLLFLSFIFAMMFSSFGCEGKDAKPTNLELEVIKEMNYARTKPKEYVSKRLQPLVESKDNEYQAYLKECISEMNSMTPCGELAYNEACFLAAHEWVEKSGPKGTIGHEKNFSDRITKYGLQWKATGENCSYGIETPIDIVIQLLIDAGVETRGHRKNILNANFTYAGASIGEHKDYRVMCCIDFAR